MNLNINNIRFNPKSVADVNVKYVFGENHALTIFTGHSLALQGSESAR